MGIEPGSRELPARVGSPSFHVKNLPDQELAWRDQCRRQLERSIFTRIKYGFAWVHKPVLDDGPSRAPAFDGRLSALVSGYLPAYLGYRLIKPRNAAQ